MRAELKAVSQEKRLKKWAEHFKNLLGALPEITDKPTKKINYQVDIKFEQFIKEELDTELKKLKLKEEKLLMK